MPLTQGQLINNRFRVIKLLGRGGFGAVYSAWDLTFELPCAIKENSEASPEAQRQFMREGRLLRTLRHANLPQVSDYFVVPNPGGSAAAYLVMDYVEGEDLAEALRKNGRPLDEAQAVNWIGQVCDALDYLHHQKPPVIHRDVKPANIKITPDGRAMLVDFGIAKVYDPRMPTTMGARAVTPGFSPMEQYGSGGHTDVHTDIYALGATLYMLLTGDPPPEAPDRQLGTPLPPITQINPSVSPAVAQAVEKALELFPGDRWASAKAFKAALCASNTAMVQVTRPSHEGRTQKSLLATIPLPEALGPKGAAQPAEKPAARRGCGLSVIIALVLLLGAVAAAPFILPLVQKQPALAWLATRTLPPATLPASPPPNRTATAAHSAAAQQTRAARAEETRSAATQAAGATVAALDAQRTQIAAATRSAAATDLALTPTAYPAAIIDHNAAMALIPAGEFRMGTEDGDVDERPVHAVYLDAFYIDRYEVTNAQFIEFLNNPGDLKEETYSWWVSDPSYGFYSGIEKVKGVWQVKPSYGKHPVTWVTWYGAQAYCTWRGARLPTEAEWEKAARGGQEGMRYPWGNDAPVCTRGAPNGAQFDDCPTGTATIGYFGANGYGLYDMAGNIMEWVADWYLRRIYTNFTPDNPTGPESGEMRVARGGAWTLNLNYLTVADRTAVAPEFADNRLGFRCAKSP